MDEQTGNIEHFPRRTLARAQGPLYQQLAEILRGPIIDGTVAVGEELPKEALIADRFGVSLITVRQALRNLEGEGLIRKRSAKPAVVLAREPHVNFGWSFKNFADMAAFTRDYSLAIKSYRQETSPTLRQHFGMGRDEAGYCLRSVLEVGSQKRAQVTTYFPPHIGAQLKRADFTDVLIFRNVERRLNMRMVVAHCTVRAEVASADVAADLDIAQGSALLVIEMLYQSADQQNVEFSIARHPADIFSITYDAPNETS